MENITTPPAAPFYVLTLPSGCDEGYAEKAVDGWKALWKGQAAPKLVVVHAPATLEAAGAKGPYSYRVRVGDLEEEVTVATYEELVEWVAVMGKGAQG